MRVLSLLRKLGTLAYHLGEVLVYIPLLILTFGACLLVFVPTAPIAFLAWCAKVEPGPDGWDFHPVFALLVWLEKRFATPEPEKGPAR